VILLSPSHRALSLVRAFQRVRSSERGQTWGYRYIRGLGQLMLGQSKPGWDNDTAQNQPWSNRPNRPNVYARTHKRRGKGCAPISRNCMKPGGTGWSVGTRDSAHHRRFVFPGITPPRRGALKGALLATCGRHAATHVGHQELFVSPDWLASGRLQQVAHPLRFETIRHLFGQFRA